MEYYWELRSKDAQNIKALMFPLKKYADWKSCFFARNITDTVVFSEEKLA